jgi:hypothetical protein
VKSNGFAPPGPPGNRGRSSATPARPSGAAPEGLPGYRAFFVGTRIEEAHHARRMWALVQLRPQTHHPDQPAAHTAFKTHCARLVSNMGHRSPHLRVLGAHVHHFQGHIPQAGQRAGRTRATGQFSCFVFRTSQLLHITRIGHTQRVLAVEQGRWGGLYTQNSVQHAHNLSDITQNTGDRRQETGGAFWLLAFVSGSEW